MPHNSSSVSLWADVSNLSQITEEIPDNITSWASAQQAKKKKQRYICPEKVDPNKSTTTYGISPKNKSSASQLNKQTKSTISCLREYSLKKPYESISVLENIKMFIFIY